MVSSLVELRSQPCVLSVPLSLLLLLCTTAFISELLIMISILNVFVCSSTGVSGRSLTAPPLSDPPPQRHFHGRPRHFAPSVRRRMCPIPPLLPPSPRPTPIKSPCREPIKWLRLHRIDTLLLHTSLLLTHPNPN